MSLKAVVHQNYIKIQYIHDGQRTKLSTGVAVSKHDNLLSVNGKLSKAEPEFINKQRLIDNAWKKATHIRDQYFINNLAYPNVKEFKDAWDNYDKRRIEDNNLNYYLEQFIVYKRKEFKSKNHKETSLQHYTALRELINDYQLFNDKEYYLEDITHNWVADFVSYLRTDKKHLENQKALFSSTPFKNSTLKKRIEKLKSLFVWLDREGIFKFPKDLMSIRKEIKLNDVVKETLTIEEVNYLSSLDLSSEHDQFIIDYFVLSCMTGMRDSDLRLISKRGIVKNSDGIYYQSQSKKTKVTFKVPVNSIALRIMEKYKYNFNRYSNGIINKGIKKVMKNTDQFNDLTDIPNNRGGFKKRYEAISIHRGRDTFITLLVEKGVDVNEIMKFTGHTDLSSLQKYLNRQKAPKRHTDLLIL